MGTRTAVATPTRSLMFLALATLLSQGANAARLEYEASVSVIHNSNIILSETEEVSETTIVPGITFELSQEGAAVDLIGRGNVRYLYYTGDSFDDEVRGEFSGHMRWRAIPDRLDLVVEDYLSEQPIDILSPFTPSNTQQVNVLIGGPTLYLHFGGSTRGQIDVRYSQSRAEDIDEFDGDRLNGAFRLLHDFSPTDRGSLNLETNRVDFDAASSAADFDRHDGYLNYQRNLNKIDFSIDAGYSRLEFDHGDDFSTTLARADLNWRITPESTFRIGAKRQFSDTTQNLAQTPIGPDQPIGTDIDASGTIVSGDPYRERTLTLGYRHAGVVHSFDAGAYSTRSRYLDDDTFDNDLDGANLGYEYRLRPLLSLVASADYQRREFDNLARRDRDTTLSAGIIKQFTRNWIGRLDLRHRSRDSSVQGFSYDDNAVIVSIIYRR